MMIKVRLVGTVAIGLIFGAVCAEAQPRKIQPSPAYFQGRAAPSQSVAPAELPEAAPAVLEAPAYRYEPQPQLTLAPASYDETVTEEYDYEDGIYWPWGQKWPGLALGPKIGTTGIGLDLIFGVNPYLNLRSGFNYGTFTWNSDLGSESYDLDVDLLSVPLLLDIYPFGNHFRISAGLYIQPDNKAKIDSTPTSAQQVGSHTYAPEVIGTLSGEIEFDNTVAPYIGIGFGNTVGEDQLLTFSLDLGVILQSYTVTLTSSGSGMDALMDTFREDLQKEQDNIQSDLDDFKLFPVLTMGLAYHF
jgi:hypothetical protein